MGKTRWMIVGLFLLAFAAGLASAVAVQQWHGHGTGPGESWLIRELNLTPQQAQKMREIWAGLARDASQPDERKAITTWRDDSIRQLIPAAQQADLDKVLSDYSAKLAELADHRRQAYEQAVKKTQAILSDEQRKKYDAIQSQRPEGRRGGPGPATSGSADMVTSPANRSGSGSR